MCGRTSVRLVFISFTVPISVWATDLSLCFQIFDNRQPRNPSTNSQTLQPSFTQTVGKRYLHWLTAEHWTVCKLMIVHCPRGFCFTNNTFVTKEMQISPIHRTAFKIKCSNLQQIFYMVILSLFTFWAAVSSSQTNIKFQRTRCDSQWFMHHCFIGVSRVKTITNLLATAFEPATERWTAHVLNFLLPPKYKWPLWFGVLFVSLQWTLRPYREISQPKYIHMLFAFIRLFRFICR